MRTSDCQNLFCGLSRMSGMINPLDAIPDHLDDVIQDLIATEADGSAFIVDESDEEILLAETGFTPALKTQYSTACELRGQDAINVYQLRRDSTGVQLIRYESADRNNVEQIWLKSNQ